MLGTVFNKIGEKFTARFPRAAAVIEDINQQLYKPYNTVRGLIMDGFRLFGFAKDTAVFVGQILPSVIAGSLTGAGAGVGVHELVVKPQINALQTETSQLETQVAAQTTQNKKLAVVVANQEKTLDKTVEVVNNLSKESKNKGVTASPQDAGTQQIQTPNNS